jgi:polysaccharide transporter, PST family
VLTAAFQRLRSSRIASNMLALTLVNLVNALLPLVTVPYLVRVLSAEGFGKAAYAQSFVSYFNVVLEYGFAFTATRAISAVRGNRAQLSEQVSTVVWAKIVLILSTSVLFFTLILFVPELRDFGMIFFITYLNVVAMTAIPTWLYQGIERLPEITWIGVGFRFLQIPLMYFFVKTKQDLQTWLLLVFLTSILTVLITWIKTVPRVVSVPSWPGWAKIFQELRLGVLIFSAQVAVSLYTVGNPFVLGQLLSVQASGVYAASERVVRVFFSFASSIQQAVFSRSAELVGNDPGRAIQVARVSLVANFVVALFLSGFVWMLAPFIQTVFLGPEFSEAKTVLRWMSVLPLLFAVGGTLTLQIVIPFRLDQGLVFVYLGAGVLNLLFAFGFVPRFGILGMVFSVTIAELFVVLAQFFLIYQHGIWLFPKFTQKESSKIE